jgi:D-alanine-D-alanine ligase
MGNRVKGKKLRLAVVYGGRSSEHDVSCRSAASIIKNLDSEKYEVIPVAITKTGNWLLNNTSLLLGHDQKKLAVTMQSSQSLVLEADPTQVRPFDIVFPVLHGTLGEDGTIQGLFEMMDVPYVGAGVLASAVGMDKDLAKRLARDAGIPIPPYLVVRRADLQNFMSLIDRIKTSFNFPVFVKPANAGSSVGVTKVRTEDKLLSALESAFLHDSKILIEKAINARDVELSVLENIDSTQPPLVSTVAAEIKMEEDHFYSYEEKYSSQSSAKILLPAPLAENQLKLLREYSQRIFSALELNGLARADFFIDKGTGEIYFNEVNTLPGFTEVSCYPKIWAASGMSYPALLSYLVDLAIKRYELNHQRVYLK